MKTRTLKELLLYNYRYWFGYTVIAGFIVYFLGWQIGSLPNGLSQQEIITAARHTNLSEIINLPVYPLHSLLQWASIAVFGVSVWSLRLASVIIGLLVAVTLYHLLKRWFGKPTALLSTAIFISADWFLFIARLGTGAVEFSLWLCLALVCFTKLLEHKTRWLILFTLSLVGLLFAPFGIYAVVTLLASLFVCRVFRERAKEASLHIKIPSILLFTAGLAAIAFISAQNIEFLKQLLGIQTLPSLLQYPANVFGNLSSVVAVLPNSNPAISPSGIFFVRFFELIFILFGIIMFWRTRVNRLNLTVLILSVVLGLASGLSSGSRGSGLMLIPAAIFMTAGIRHLIHRWQKTFPKNPYARITAYLPLAFLFICVVSLHYASYFVLWPSQASTANAFSQDHILLQKELRKNGYAGKNCYVDSDETAFNQLVIAGKPVCTVQFLDREAAAARPKSTIIITRPGSPFATNKRPQNVKALTSEALNGNVRWLIIKNQVRN